MEVVGIKSIKKIENRTKFDLEVKKNNNFFANDILVHNCRCITIIKDGIVKTFSRTGKEFDTLDVLKDTIKNEILNDLNSREFLPSSDFVLDGEICIVDEDGREDFTSIMKEIKKKDHIIKNPKYKIFDILSLEDFLSQTSEEILSTRIDRYKMINSPSGILDCLDQTKITSFDQLSELFNQAIEKNWEGLILRKDVEYKGKRSNDLLKLKKFHDAEYKVTGTVNDPFRIIDKKTGLEKTEMMMASVTIEHDGNTVNVGSGFSIDQRKKFFKSPDLIIGKVITVQYFELSKDKNGKESLRFPTLKIIHGEERDV